MNIRMLILSVVMVAACPNLSAWGQSVSGVRAFGGGVAPLFGLVGPGNLYLDNQGTQGYMYTFNAFESFSFRNPASGQAWSGAVMTLGPRLSIGVIQGVNQAGSPLVLVPPPPTLSPPLVSPFSLGGVTPLVTPVLGVTQTTAPLVGGSLPTGGMPGGGGAPSILLVPPPQPSSEVEPSLLDIP